MSARVVALPASVTMDDASAALRSIESALSEAGGGGIQIDAAALSEVDTAAVALLLQAQRLTRSRGQAATLVNPPDKLLALARLYGVESLLGGVAAGSA
jgi:phospholipid transport system transporter-binding protein